jgi:UDP:flavonoid glycosyltransferase YjiC (YdhE family)
MTREHGSDAAATVLSVLPHAGGNVSPTLAVLNALALRGRRIVVLGHEQLRDAVEDAGFAFHVFDQAARWSASVERPGVRSMLRYLTLASDRGSGRDLTRVAALEGPDVVLLDCMMPSAMPAARRTGVPVVTIMHTLYAYWDSQWSPGTPMGLWLRVTGTLPTATARLPDVAVLTTMREIDIVPKHSRFPRSLIAQTGPPLRAAPARAVAEDAPVLISLSTISYPGQAEVLQRLVDAVADLPVRAIVTTGPSLDPLDITAPANVTVHQFVDHDEVMKTARLVIGHGGHGTTMRALAHGVPVLVVPMSSHADHQLVADALVAAGTGATVSKHATPDELRSAMARALDDDPIHSGARRMAELLADRDGASAAADVIDSVIARRR